MARIPIVPNRLVWGMDVGAWLRELGLERYATAFRENEITADVLPHLSAEDLKEIGVGPVGHRRQLLTAINALGDKGRAGADQNNEGADSPGEARAAEVLAATASGAERRQITVMFCDLVGSTELSTKVDPEDLRQFLQSFFSTMSGEIERHHGFVARHLGDGALVYFGYPESHENEAESAVRAALAVVATVSGLAPLIGVRPQVRVGIATGLVVVGELLGSSEGEGHDILGETPNLASRLQSLAEPGGVVIDETTRRLIGDLFQCRRLEPVSVKGFAAPMVFWEVLGESNMPSRFEALHSRLTPLVGRDEELDLLVRRWTQATSGEGRVVLISGEAGIGKSRLTVALRERAAAQPHVCLQFFCAPHMSESALYPILSRLEHAAGFKATDSAEAKLQKLKTVLVVASRNVDEDAALLAEFLAIPNEGRYPKLTFSAEKLKELVLELLCAQVERLAQTQPVLMILEDMQWIDPTSRELLDITFRRIESLPVLLVVTYRSGFTPPWLGESYVTALTLPRLGRRHNAAMLDRLTGGRRLPAELADQILARTDGIPLFVEELTKSVLESGILREEEGAYVLAGPLAALAVPTSLQASLSSRLDRLAPIRHVAQIGAALGREFSYNIVRAVMDLPDGALRAAFDRLVGAELVYQRGTPPDAVYTFKHALVQDATYETLLRSQRVLIHARITEVLERKFPETAARHPELFAHHATQAGLWEKAVGYHLDAAQRMLARSAAVEACGQIRKGQALLEHLNEDDVRRSLDYKLHARLADALKMLKGWMAPEVGTTLSRLREHPGRQPNSLEDFKISVMLWGFYWRVDLQQAHRMVEQMMKENEEDVRRITFCHFCLGSTKIVHGDFTGAKRSFIHFVEHCKEEAFTAMDYNSGLDTEGLALARLGIAHLALGDVDQARQAVEKGIREARATARPFSLSTVLSTAIYVYSILGDVDRTAALAHEGWSIAEDQKFAYLSARIAQHLGWVDVMQGRLNDGVERIERATAAVRSMRGRVHNGYFLCLLAACHLRAGQIERAGQIAAEAIAEIGETEERWREAEAWRIWGDVKLAASPDRDEEAEVIYRRALDIASKQNARFWQLQAATSLARLLLSRGDRDQARALLVPIFNGMREGFDVPDMIAARELLTEISPG